MTTELGSDAQFKRLDDTAQIGSGFRAEARRALLEEWRTRMQPTEAAGEPGQDFPDPDETPPGDPPEFDPLPREG